MRVADTAARLRDEQRFADLCLFLEREAGPRALRKDPALAALYLRALGEARGPEPLARAFAGLEPTIGADDLARLFLFAFAGRRDLTARLLDGPLHDLAAPTRRFWLATADLAGARPVAALVEFEALRDCDDPVIQKSAARRVAEPLPARGTQLSPASRALLDRVAQRLGEEERYADRPNVHHARPVVVWALAAVLCAVFAVEVALGGSTNLSTLRGLGALVPYDVARKGAWWRLATFSLLHAGPFHLAANVAGLWVLGPFVERAFGRLRVLAIYLAAALAGGLVTVALFFLPGHDAPTLLVGASGGVMGLVGATAAILFRAWRVEKARVALDRLVVIASLVVAQAVLDQLVPMLSASAHATGALVGFVVALPMRAPAGRRLRD